MLFFFQEIYLMATRTLFLWLWAFGVLGVQDVPGFKELRRCLDSHETQEPYRVQATSLLRPLSKAGVFDQDVHGF